MFYPQLPYYFQIYFKDRQRARIELMFNVVDQDNKNIVMVKRKISSGNLEADLLSMRYIGHYLSIQQAGLPKNNWQSIKIELSAKDPSQ
jgi:predicted transcriptional regulator